MKFRHNTLSQRLVTSMTPICKHHVEMPLKCGIWSQVGFVLSLMLLQRLIFFFTILNLYKIRFEKQRKINNTSTLTFFPNLACKSLQHPAAVTGYRNMGPCPLTSLRGWPNAGLTPTRPHLETTTTIQFHGKGGGKGPEDQRKLLRGTLLRGNLMSGDFIEGKYYTSPLRHTFLPSVV